MEKYHLAVLLIIILGAACTHDPILLDGIDDPGQDSTGSVPLDTMAAGTPCDPQTVYFNRQILPILVSNCTESGCHNANDAPEGIVLVDYQSILASNVIKSGNLDESDLYEVLIESDPEKVMPQPPNERLTGEQIGLIASWILQGAKNLTCDDRSAQCESSDVSFREFVEPLIQTYCKGCHSGGEPSGNVSLDGYEQILAVANGGRLMGAISWLPGFARMPRNQPQLDECDIEKIKSWIDAGAQNN